MKIYIIDDEPMIIEVLKAYFEKIGYQVFFSTNGIKGLNGIHEVQPDFIILDLMLPDMTGEAICQEIRKTSDVPILMLTAKTSEEDRIHGIVIGADDYVTKPFSPREVVVRVQSILKRVQSSKSADILSFNNAMLVIYVSQNQVKVRGTLITLTPIEFRLLTQMARHPGRVYTRQDLLMLIQDGDYYEGYERSIDVHIKNLRKKIEEDSRNPVFLLTVFGVGYKFGGYQDVSDPKY